MAATGRRTPYQLTFAVLAVAVVAYALLQSLIVPVLSTLRVDLHTSQNTVTWVLTAYLLSASIATPIMGRVGDMIGKERAFLATLLALSLGSLLAALAPNVGVMIVARVIQGIGGGVLPLSFGIVRDEFPETKVSGAVGFIASLAAVGAGLGIVLAGPIMNLLDYHWLFWFPMILTTATMVGSYFLVPRSPVHSPGRISWPPALLLSAWLLALLLALSEGPVWGWGSLRVIGLCVLAVPLIAAWAAAEKRAPVPVIDLEMMRQPAVWTNNVVAFLIGLSAFAVYSALPEFVQTPSSAGYGFSASVTQSSLVLLPSAIAMFMIGLYAGRVTRWVGGKTMVITGCLIAIGAMTMLAFLNTALWQLYLATGLQGLGSGLAFSAMSGLIVAAVPPNQTGVVSGMNSNIRTIGGSVGAALMASVVTSRLASNGLPAKFGYTLGFGILAAALVVGTIAASFMPAHSAYPAPAPDEEPLHPQLAVLAGGTLVGDKPE